jgi:hypothetical protein
VISNRSIRRRCRRLVDALDMPDPFDPFELCGRVANQRGRPIALHAVSMPPGTPGIWVSAGQRDYILYERDTSPLHQEHIILHELGHLLCHHTSGVAISPEISRLLLPDIDPDVVNRVLQRTVYSTHDEREAETIASLLLERANRWQPAPEWPVPAEALPIGDRIGRTFDPPTDRR